MAFKLSRAFWKGSFYYRKRANSWRDAETGKVIKSRRDISKERLDVMAGKGKTIEPSKKILLKGYRS